MKIDSLNLIEKIINLPPPHQFFLCIILFIGGIFASSFLFFDIAIFIGLILFLFCLMFGLVGFLFERKISILIYFLIFLLGFFYFQFYNFYQEKNSSRYLNNTFQNDVLAIIDNTPIYDDGIVSFNAKLLKPNKGKILIKARSYEEIFQYGDKIRLSGKFEEPQKYENFDYAAYLAKDNIYSLVNYPEIEVIKRNEGLKLKEILYKIKIVFQKQIDKVFPEPESGFLSGLLLGEKKTMDENLQLALQRSGTTHLIALSGYNITIIVEAVYFLLIGIGVARPKSFFWVLIFLIFFIILTGASPSVVRAGIMGALLILSNKLGKKYQIRNALFLAALLMILFNPKILRFDFGFQLSFAATLGLIYLKPIFDKLLKVEKQSFFDWREILATTLSAQIMVLPLLILNFGYVSIVSPITNILIISFIPITMLLGFLAVLISFLNLWLGYLVGVFSYFFLHSEIFIIKIFGNLPLATLNFGIYNKIIFLISIGLIILFIVYHKKYEFVARKI